MSTESTVHPMLDDANRPTTKHIIRPHHVALLSIFMLAFKDFESKLPNPFFLHIHRVLLQEVAEIAEPRSHQELVIHLSSGPKAETIEAQRLINKFKITHEELKNTDELTQFFVGISVLFEEKAKTVEPSEYAPFTHRSIFGFFCRRCSQTYFKLSFSGAVKLQRDYLAWCNGNGEAGYEPVIRDHWNNGDLFIFQTSGDFGTWSQTEDYTAWQKGEATGDENVASENLRRFFEQRFHKNPDSGLRQHALLNLARMHYVRDEFVATRNLLKEAIAVARTYGDRVTLQHCICLLHRLPPEDPERKPLLNEIQPDIHPMEFLFDVKKLMTIKHQQPLSASFEKIIQALGVYDSWAEQRLLRGRYKSVDVGTGTDQDQWAFHTVQAIVWSAAGCHELAEVEENIVVAFTEIGSDDNNRLTAILNRAYRRARQGKYRQALVMLLKPDVWRGLSSTNYLIWANQVWHILILRASRRGQYRMAHEYLEPRQPPGSYYRREYWFDSPGNSAPLIQDPLYEVLELLQCGQGTASINQLLTALWHSEFLGRLGLYRTGIILLSDIQLEFGMTKRCQRIVEEIMPQIINGGDLEQRALACFVLARCIIASADEDQEPALQQALHFLQQSESDYQSIDLLRPLLDVQYLLSIVYHNLNMEKEREEAARRHFETERRRKELEVIVFDSEVDEVWKLVSSVGTALAAR